MGFAVISEINKTPFIQATEPVRQKFGAKYADLIKRVHALK
jgi:hypothetical protein